MELVARQLVERWKLKQIIQKSAKGRRKFHVDWLFVGQETDTDLHVP